MSIIQHYLNPRMRAILCLGFASGLPLALSGSSLQAWFTQSGVDIVTIGMLSLLGLPYIWKFLWAPLMDHYTVFRLGKRRGWILITQLSLAMTLFWLAQGDPSTISRQMAGIALLLAFFAASQDVAIDAYRVDILPENERGLGSAFHIFAYRMAILISGGFTLILADYLGWRLTYQCMAILMLLSMLPTYWAPQPTVTAQPRIHLWQTIYFSLKTLFQREKIAWILLFILFYKLGDAMALSLMTNFLLASLKFSLTEVGIAYKTMSIIATIFGALVGGVILMRWSMYWALMIFGLAQAFSNAMFILLAVTGKHFFLMAASIFIENFCSGMSTAALLAFLMSLCHSQYTATQFALLSAIASLGRVLIGPIAGIVVAQVGWVSFYTYAFLLSFPGLLFLIMLKNEVVYNVQIQAAAD